MAPELQHPRRSPSNQDGYIQPRSKARPAGSKLEYVSPGPALSRLFWRND